MQVVLKMNLFLKNVILNSHIKPKVGYLEALLITVQDLIVHSIFSYP